MPAYFTVELVSYYVLHYEGEVLEHIEPWTIDVPVYASSIDVNAVQLVVDMALIVATADLLDNALSTSLIEYNATISVDNTLAIDIPAYTTSVFIDDHSSTMES